MDTQDAIREFHRHFYESGYGGGTWKNTAWLGVPTEKNPLDLWIYQEILYLQRPDLVIETGTLFGGSALYLASLMDLLGCGRVVTVDIQDRPGRPCHPRVSYITGNSVEPSVVRRVSDQVKKDEKVMVILDSNHFLDHVLGELASYHGLVSPGSYLIVEDGNVNGNPVNRGHGPGPFEAVGEFLQTHPEFVRDQSCEKYFLTFNPGGYLRKVR